MIIAAADGPGRRGGPPPLVPARDMVAKEGDRLTLGGTTLIMHHTRGHTPGGCRLSSRSSTTALPLHILFGRHWRHRRRCRFQGHRRQYNPDSSIENIEVGLTDHSWLGDDSYPNGAIFERAALFAGRGPNDPHSFIDADSWEIWVNAAHQRNLEEARREAAAEQ